MERSRSRERWTKGDWTMRGEQWTESTRPKRHTHALASDELLVQAEVVSVLGETGTRPTWSERPGAFSPPATPQMPAEDVAASLQHIGNGRPCRYFNAYGGACLNGALCPFQHAPDDFSLRLSPALGNICEAHLVRIGGCTLGTRCWYSHDLENGAGFPVDDAWALKETLERVVRMRKDERRTAVCRGDMVKQRGEGATVMVMEGKSGDEILKELGGRRPMGKQGGTGRQQQQQQQQWQQQARVQPYQQSHTQQMENEEEERMENMGWTNDQMNELASYGIKPWEHDEAYVSRCSLSGSARGDG